MPDLIDPAQEPDIPEVAAQNSPDLAGKLQRRFNPGRATGEGAGGPGDGQQSLKPAEPYGFGFWAGLQDRFRKDSNFVEQFGTTTGVNEYLKQFGIAKGWPDRNPPRPWWMRADDPSLAWTDNGIKTPSEHDRMAALEWLSRAQTDMMLFESQPWPSDPAMLLAAVAGHLWGSKYAPETYFLPGVGKLGAAIAAKGGSEVTARALALGTVIAGGQAVTDPMIQMMRVQAELQDSYHFTETALSVAGGALLGLGGVYAYSGGRAWIRGWRPGPIPGAGPAVAGAPEPLRKGFVRLYRADAEGVEAVEKMGAEFTDDPKRVFDTGSLGANKDERLTLSYVDVPEAIAEAMRKRPGVYNLPEDWTGRRKPLVKAKPFSGDLEQIGEAAVEINGRVFTGPTHSEAMENASKELGQSIDDIVDAFNKGNVAGIKQSYREGFTTKGGRFVEYKEATQIEKRSEAHPLDQHIEGLKALIPPPGAGRPIPRGEQSYGDRMATHLAERNGLNINEQYPGTGREAVPLMPVMREGSNPGQAGGIAGDAPNIRKEWQTFADELGVAVRDGRLQKKGAEGEYDVGAAIIRLKKIDDVTALAHEAAHFIENTGGQQVRGVIDDPANAAELMRITGYARTQKTPELQKTEGFAEFFRLFVENPEEAKKRAPNTYDAFVDFLDANPDIKNPTAALQLAMEHLQAASPFSRVLANQADAVDVYRTPGFWKQVEKDGFGQTIIAHYDRLYSMTLDKNQATWRVTRNLAKLIKERTGQLVEMNVEDDPHRLATLASRGYQNFLSHLQHGVSMTPTSAPVSKGLTELFTEITGKANAWSDYNAPALKEFGAYLEARWGVRLWERAESRRGAGETVNDPSGHSKETYEGAIREYEKANPDARKWADTLYDWKQARFDYEFTNQIIDPDLYKQLRTPEWREYVPFLRDVSDRTGGANQSGGEVDLSGPILKRFRGSSRPVINPIETLIMQGMQREDTIWSNKMARAMATLAEQAGPGGAKFVEHIPAQEVQARYVDAIEGIQKLAEQQLNMSPEDAKLFTVSALNQMNINGEAVGPVTIFRSEIAQRRGENIVFYLDQGKLQAFRLQDGRVGQEIASTLSMASNPQMFDMAITQMQRAARWMRTGVITNPQYLLRNFMLDQMTAFDLARGYIPLYDGVKGMSSAVKDDEFAQIYAKSGGLAGGVNLASLDRLIDFDLEQLTKKGIKVTRMPNWETFFKATELSETGTRLGLFRMHYERAIKQGMDPDTAALNAAFEATDLLPFGRGGTGMEVVRRIVPFMSGNIQGLNKAWRTTIAPLMREQITTADVQAKSDAYVAIAKLTSQTALHAMYRAAYMGNPEFEEFNDRIRNRFTMIKMGDTWMAIPKAFELAIPMNFAERMVEHFAMKDSRAFEKWKSGALDLVTAPYVYDATGIKLPVELMTNYDMYWKRQIVPDRMQSWYPYMQVQENTNKYAKEMGTAVKDIQQKLGVENPKGVSPMLLQHLARGLFGTWATDFGTMTDAAANLYKGDGSYDFLNKLAVTKYFFRSPELSSQSVDAFWHEVGRSDGRLKMFSDSVAELQRNHPDEASKLYGSGQPDQRAYATLMVGAATDRGSKSSRSDGFSPEAKMLHPLQRSQVALKEIGDIIKGINGNDLTALDGGKPVDKIEKGQKEVVVRTLQRIRMWEARNALILAKIPGSEGKEVQSLEPEYEVLRKMAPQVLTELANRYANKKIPQFDKLYTLWPQVHDELIKNRSDAKLGSYVTSAYSDGYELGADRIVRRPRPRMRMQ